MSRESSTTNTVFTVLVSAIELNLSPTPTFTIQLSRLQTQRLKPYSTNRGTWAFAHTHAGLSFPAMVSKWFLKLSPRPCAVFRSSWPRNTPNRNLYQRTSYSFQGNVSRLNPSFPQAGGARYAGMSNQPFSRRSGSSKMAPRSYVGPNSAFSEGMPHCWSFVLNVGFNPTCLRS